jgi:hypothetical protein
MFEKRLGGVRAVEGAVSVVPDYDVPETLDAARGRVSY